MGGGEKQLTRGSAPKTANRIAVADDVYGYFSRIKQDGFYNGVPPKAESISAIAKKAWDHYKLGEFVGANFGKAEAKKIYSKFEEEIRLSLYVQAGELHLLKTKGQVEVELGGGKKVTLKAEDFTPDMVTETAVFMGINAAIFGRVGTISGKNYSANLLMHLLSAGGRLSEKEEGDAGANRPSSKHTYGAIGSSVEDMLKGKPELLEKYKNYQVMFSGASSRKIYKAFIDKGYLPTTPGKTAGNVEILIHTAYAAAKQEFGEGLFEPAKKAGGEEEKIPVLPPTSFDGQDKHPAAPPGEMQPTKEVTPAKLPRASLSTSYITDAQMDYRSIRDLMGAKTYTPKDFLGMVPKKSDMFDYKSLKSGDLSALVKSLNGITSLTDAAGRVFNVTPLRDSGSVRELAKFVITNAYLNGGNTSFIAQSKDGSRYRINYTLASTADGRSYDIEFVKLGAADEKQPQLSLAKQQEQIVLHLKGDYWTTYVNQSPDVKIKGASFDLTVPQGHMYGKGSMQVSGQERADGTFALGAEIADSQGRKAHFEISGKDFNWNSANLNNFKFNESNPLQSTIDVAGRQVTLLDIARNTDHARRLFTNTLSESVTKGYVSFSAGYEPFSVDMTNLSVKARKNGEGDYTWAADAMSFGIGGKNPATMKFDKNEFRMNFGGDITTQAAQFEWRANGQTMLSFNIPQMTQEKADRVRGATKDFTKTLSEKTAELGFYGALRVATYDFMKVFKAESPDASVQLNVAGILQSFDGKSEVGSIAKYGLGPGLQADAKNGGTLKFTLSELDELAKVMREPDARERWSRIGSILAPKLGLAEGQALVDNTVMGMYFCNLNMQMDMVDRAVNGINTIKAFSSRTSYGATSATRIGASYTTALNSPEEGEPQYYAGVTADLAKFGVSPFGKAADLSHINIVQQTVGVSAIAGVRYAHFDFGAGLGYTLKMEDGIDAANALRDGDTIYLKISDQKKNGVIGYAFVRYSLEGGVGKMDATFVAGVAPSAYDKHWGIANYGVMLFRGGLELSGQTAELVYGNYGVSFKGSADIANVADLKRGFSQFEIRNRFKLADNLMLYNSLGANVTMDGKNTAFVPYVGIEAGIGEHEKWKLWGKYTPNGVNKYGAGVSYLLY